MESELVSLISQFGFPMAVAIYFILDNRKTSKALDKNTEALQELKSVIAIHTEQTKK